MVKVKVYIEGGGNQRSLLDECRKGFRLFLEKAGFNDQNKNRPVLVACGSRNDVFDRFCTAIKQGENAILLVDSEDLVDSEYKGKEDDYATWKPFDFLSARDGWSFEKNNVPAKKFPKSECGHLMVCCMESWLVSDLENLAEFYGQGFKGKSLTTMSSHPETTAKNTVYKELRCATAHTKTKGEYGKGPHSFKILATTSPDKVMAASPWAKRFIECLKERMKGGR